MIQEQVFITGVNGQDGSLLANALINKGLTVSGVGKQVIPRTSLDSRVKYFSLDLRIPGQVAGLLDYLKPKYIFHFAAVHGNSKTMKILERNSTDDMFQVMVGTAQEILEWQLYHDRSSSYHALTSQMYSLSSSSGHDSKITLNSKRSPSNYYAQCKSEIWDLILRFREKLSISATGLVEFNHTSLESKAEFLVPQLAKRLASEIADHAELLDIPGGDTRIDISHALDFVDAIVKITEDGHPYNDFILGSGKLVTINSLASSALEYLGLPISLSTQKQPANNFGIYGDISATVNDLNWCPKRDVSQLLAEVIRAELESLERR